MRILILGGDGRQGRAIQNAFIQLNNSIRKISYEVVDETFGHMRSDVEQYVKQKWDLVISCLPYEQNILYGTICINAGNRWADLGSHIESNKVLRSLAYDKSRVIATDIGLAPGLIEYLGLRILEQVEPKPQQMRLMCGGLPVTPVMPFGYQIVFSPEGVVNNYVDMCEVILSKHIIKTDSMDDNSIIYLDGLSLETGNSSGGVTWTFLKTMLDRGIVDCYYQTLRYPGHWDMAIKAWDRYSLSPDDKEAREDMANWIRRHAQADGDDVVFLGVDLDTNLAYNTRIDAEGGLSAMQRSTAFPAACVSILLAQGGLDHVNGPVGPQDIAGRSDFWEMLYTILPEVE